MRQPELGQRHGCHPERSEGPGGAGGALNAAQRATHAPRSLAHARDDRHYTPTIAKNSSSESTGTPSALAFSSSEPAASPAMTYDVFADTAPEALPPSRSISLWISSREKRASVPVTTTVLPARRSPVADGTNSGVTPRRCIFAMRSRFAGTEK